MTDWSRIALTTNRSGQTVRASGIYQLCELDGTPHAAGTEYTLVKGEVFPPAPARHLVYQLVRLSHHKGDAPDTPPDEDQP